MQDHSPKPVSMGSLSGTDFLLSSFKTALRESWTDGLIFQDAKQQLPLEMEYTYKGKQSNLLGFLCPLRSTPISLIPENYTASLK